MSKITHNWFRFVNICIVFVLFCSTLGLLILLVRFLQGSYPVHTWTIGAPVSVLVFSPAGEFFAVGTETGMIQLRQSSDGRVVRSFDGLQFSVAALAFSPDGQLLASSTCSNESDIQIWQVKDGKLRAAFGRPYLTCSLAFSSDGQTLAAGNNWNRVSLWDIDSARLTKTMTGPPGPPLAHGGSVAVDWIAFSKDGSMLIACNQDEGIRTWRLPGESEQSTAFGMDRNTTSNIISAAAFSPDAHTVATSYFRIGYIYVWPPNNPKQGLKVPSSSYVRSMAFSPDGQLLASGGGVPSKGSLISSLVSPYNVYLSRTADGSVQTVLMGHTDVVRSLAWEPDGRYLASGSEDGTVRFWEAK